MNRDIRQYFKDRWNVLDAFGLLFLFIGMVIRWEDWTSPWGPAFYALSTPLVISRVLFFAQILPFQGPLIEVSVHDLVQKIHGRSCIMSCAGTRC